MRKHFESWRYDSITLQPEDDLPDIWSESLTKAFISDALLE
jgi:hypothetical protein